MFWDSWGRTEQLEIVFVPLLVLVVARESLLSFWPLQELFLKADAAKESHFAGSGFQPCSQPSLGSGTTLGTGWNLLSVVLMFTNRKNPGAEWKPALCPGESSLPEDSEHSKLLSWADGIPYPQKTHVLTKLPFPTPLHHNRVGSCELFHLKRWEEQICMSSVSCCH